MKRRSAYDESEKCVNREEKGGGNFPHEAEEEQHVVGVIGNSRIKLAIVFSIANVIKVRIWSDDIHKHFTNHRFPPPSIRESIILSQ